MWKEKEHCVIKRKKKFKLKSAINLKIDLKSAVDSTNTIEAKIGHFFHSRNTFPELLMRFPKDSSQFSFLQ